MNTFLKVVKIGIVLFIGWVLLLAAIGKLLDNRHFAEVLAQWQLFPSWSLLPLGVVMSLLELVLAAWLFSGRRLAQAALVSVLFHLGYTTGTVITLLRGISLPDCGCFGILFAHPLDWPMAIEDFIAAILSFVLYGIVAKWKPAIIVTLLVISLGGNAGVAVWKKSVRPAQKPAAIFPRDRTTMAGLPVEGAVS